MATVVAPPEPLSLDQARAHLRVDTDDSDDLIEGLITAAREYAEDYTGLVLTPRAITETARQLGRWIDLTSWPVVSVDAIRYPTAAGMTPLPAGAWLSNLTKRPARVVPASWGWGIGGTFYAAGYQALGASPAASSLPVEIDVTAGYATPDLVPQAIKQAMLLLCQSWFDNRSAVEAGTRAAAIEVPFTVDVLLRKHRIGSI